MSSVAFSADFSNSLSNATLKNFVGTSVETPAFDRSAATVGIVHLGIGGFHRSHQAPYVQEALASGETQWGICAVGLMQHDEKICTILQKQDGLYTLLERDQGGDCFKIVGSIVEVLWGYNDPDSVLDRMAASSTKIISLTVTEKGYCFNNDGDLDLNHPFIQKDLANIDRPVSASGFIVAGLKRRMQQGGTGLTVLSCDNLPQNGDKTKKAVLTLARQVDADLAVWIEQNITFPNSMVDRITPVTTDAITGFIADQIQMQDAWPVVSEGYRQWVIEDKFAEGRPTFEEYGVQFVGNVHPYELMKVRLLNGSHSALSYISLLCGYHEVDEAMAQPHIRQFLRAYMDISVTPTLAPVLGIDLDQYKDTLIERFANNKIKDTLLRLAEDGSQKIPNAILPCIEWHVQQTDVSQRALGLAAFALAAWFEFIRRQDETTSALRDPLLTEMKSAAIKGNAEDVLALTTVFRDVGQHRMFVDLVQKHWTTLQTANGTEEIVRAVNAMQQ